jgi:hypothetical protein
VDGWSSPGYNKSIPVHVHQVVEVDGKGLSDEDLKEQRVTLVEYGDLSCKLHGVQHETWHIYISLKHAILTRSPHVQYCGTFRQLTIHQEDTSDRKTLLSR